MSHSTNSNVNFCDVCILSFETKTGLYRHQSCDSKHKELLEQMFGSDYEAPINVKPKSERALPPSPQPEAETGIKGASPLVPQPITENMERVYDLDED